MKLALPLLLSAATTASNSVSSPALPLASDLPDRRFRVDLGFDAPFLPVNATLVNIMHFMSIVARTDTDEDIQPRTYSAPMYRQVQITTCARTEARFLLWGIYLAAIDMVKFSRFHNAMVKLYWENSLVGQINLMVKPSLSSPSASGNDTRSLIDDGGQLGGAGIGDKATKAFGERLNTTVQNITGSNTVETISAVNAAKMRNAAFSIPSQSPILVPPNALLSPRLTIDFDRVAGATKLSRNDVFLTFYHAMLHVAKFPVENDMRPFYSKSPFADLRVHMYETGIGCLVTTPLTSCTPSLMRV